mmetsp:Transcript_10219/g.22671  ORF Transcript_10219/g.22671 Transcript_10219/m.22671 type:complete len:324 (-) Transcript_10219:47-1018(-)
MPGPRLFVPILVRRGHLERAEPRHALRGGWTEQKHLLSVLQHGHEGGFNILARLHALHAPGRGRRYLFEIRLHPFPAFAQDGLQNDAVSVVQVFLHPVVLQNGVLVVRLRIFEQSGPVGEIVPLVFRMARAFQVVPGEEQHLEQGIFVGLRDAGPGDDGLHGALDFGLRHLAPVSGRRFRVGDDEISLRVVSLRGDVRGDLVLIAGLVRRAFGFPFGPFRRRQRFVGFFRQLHQLVGLHVRIVLGEPIDHGIVIENVGALVQPGSSIITLLYRPWVLFFGNSGGGVCFLFHRARYYQGRPGWGRNSFIIYILHCEVEVIVMVM